MEGGGGKSSQLGPPPTITLNQVWALKPPWAHGHKITYAPINLTALCIMIFMQASPILGWVGPWNSQYLWAPNGTRLTARAISRGPQISRVPGPNPPRNGLARMKTIMHGAVRFTGA